MKRQVTATAAALAVLLTAGAALADEAPKADGAGLFGGFELSVARANIDPATNDDLPDVGALVGAHLGYRFGWGLGLSVGFSGSSFDFELEAAGQTIDADLATDLIDVSAWYFLPLGNDLQLHIRGGLGLAGGDFSIDSSALLGAGGLGGLGGFGQETPQIPQGQSEEGLGFVLSAGLDWRARQHMRLFADVHMRTTGVAMDVEGLDDDLFTIGLSVGVGWMP